MFAGISTACFYPELTEKAFDFLVENNVAAVEIFLNSNGELEPSYLKEMKKKADYGGTDIISVHPFTSRSESYWLFSEYERRFHEARETFKEFFEATRTLGATSLVFHGDSMYGRMIPFEQYIERYVLLAEDALSFGVNLSLENVYFFRTQEPEFFSQTLDAFPQSQFVLDTKQTVISNKKIDDYLYNMKDHIHHIHFSDSAADQPCLPPGKGEMDIDSFLTDLDNIGFDGALIIELYRHNYKDNNELLESYKFLENKINNFSETKKKIDKKAI